MMKLTRLTTLADLPRRPKVLVVGDRPAITKTACQMLSTDCQVVTASDGPAALALCTTTPPDLVLVDDEATGTNGLQFLEQFKAAQSLLHIPVVFIVSPVDSVRETAYLDAGVADFVTTPVNPVLLHARVGTHLLLKFQSDELLAMDFHDGLTGVYSRHYLEKQIDVESGRAKRSGNVLSLLIIDVDHFKAYNSYYGHQAGDDALRLIARVVESKLQRPGDLVARSGDDEFVGLLPATDFEPAMHLADQITREVRARGIGHASLSAAPIVTVSIGVATRRRALDGEPEALLRVAAEQIAQAKQQGGARVCGKVLYRP